MDIREASEQDIPDIVNLLKLSLGEGLMPKSERYWRWKHIENPFGTSPVLLCFEDGVLIGVRAFMRWEWIRQANVYRAVRAVDTATHPAHQGKGIFKKLTLELLDFCKRSGVHFVFNTPNDKSRPGYLKMGWEETGRLPIRGSVPNPLSIISRFLAKPAKPAVEGNELKYALQHPQLDVLLHEHRRQMKNMYTNVSTSYVKWRYLDVPVAQYVAIVEEKQNQLTGLLIGRIKDSRLGREFRVTDSFLSEQSTGEMLRLRLKHYRKIWGIDYCTLSGTVSPLSKKIFPGYIIAAPVGPMVTVRSLNIEDIKGTVNFEKWSPTLGDLELF